MTKANVSSSAKNQDVEYASLRQRWKDLYHDFLPVMAKSKDPVQPHWPVFLDHCFARIILDNVVGEGKRPWTEVIGKPAIDKMDSAQLQAAIALAEKIARGERNLVELDEASLRARGKKSKRKHDAIDTANHDGNVSGAASKRQRRESEDEEAEVTEEHTKSNDRGKRARNPNSESTRTVSSYFQPKASKPGKTTPLANSTSVDRSESPAEEGHDADDKDNAPRAPFLSARSTSLNPDMASHLREIDESPKLTPFRKETLSLLCQIPRGRWSTYGAMSNFINRVRAERQISSKHQTSPSAKPSSKSTCARAIGSAMKNNPFAPGVPCHRILAGDGSLGGFGGSWGENGTYADEKRRLLKEEGVNFDGRGKAMGEAWTGFKELVK